MMFSNFKDTYSTTLGCLRLFKREISLIAVLGTPSSSFSSLIFLRATYSPVTLSYPLYTTPQVPSPSFSSFLYLSIFEAGAVIDYPVVEQLVPFFPEITCTLLGSKFSITNQANGRNFFLGIEVKFKFKLLTH